MITSVARKLPKPVKGPLRWFYDKWRLRVTLDRQFVRDLAEYFNLSEREVIYFLKQGLRMHADLWKASRSRSEEEVKEFYTFTPFYIFELAYWHMQRDQRIFRKQVASCAHGDVLDYGGGIGDLCADLAERGLCVTYADVEGRTFEFAKWLFKKRNTSVDVINLSEEGLTKEYDTIICLDVIEHVPTPKELLIQLTSHIKKGGSLIITNLQVDEVLKIHPMHYKVDFSAEEYLGSIGFHKGEFPWLWVKR